MVLQIQDWVFDIDCEATQEYTRHLLEDHCECGYCRNYYRAVIDNYPSLKCFLESVSSHVEAPVDFLPVEPTLCVVSYAVSGKIVRPGKGPILLNETSLAVQDQTQLDYELKCKQPYFVFTTDYMELPWLLDEDMNEVISPANEPECLERMWRKLLGSADQSLLQS